MRNREEREKRAFRTFGWSVIATCIMALSGCSFMGECLRYESRTVQVCQRMEANGHCAHYGMRTQNYCAERARNDRVY